MLIQFRESLQTKTNKKEILTSHQAETTKIGPVSKVADSPLIEKPSTEEDLVNLASTVYKASSATDSYNDSLVINSAYQKVLSPPGCRNVFIFNLAFCQKCAHDICSEQYTFYHLQRKTTKKRVQRRWCYFKIISSLPF